MILIADAGSTKIEWALLPKLEVTTNGFNAAISSPSLLKDILTKEASELLEEADAVDSIYYYGAGCVGERAQAITEALCEVFNPDLCQVESDLLAAARALCGREAGIACILGTGSNSCLYDGKKITANTPALGFILGDEGSGAVLGKIFIGRLLKGDFPPQVSERFRESRGAYNQAEIIRRVYREERPNAFLASLAPFIAQNLDIKELEEMVTDEFVRFLRLNVLPYKAPALPVNFVGSIALVFASQLKEAAGRLGLTVGKILKSPLEAFIEYHLAD